MAVVPPNIVPPLTFRPESAESAVRDLAAALDELGPHANAIVFQHGSDLDIREGNADYAINAVFTTRTRSWRTWHLRKPTNPPRIS